MLTNLVLLGFLLIIGFGVARQRNLFAAVMLFAICSLVSAALFVVLDAVDVALTEAVVGAGISSILMLATLALVSSRDKSSRRGRVLPMILCVLTGALLIYATADLPPVGDPLAAPHRHVAPRYLTSGPEETGVPNVVTAVLASYRGYDTLGEVTVIFTAGVGVWSLLGLRAPRGAGRR